jgi:PRC-barrel domain
MPQPRLLDGWLEWAGERGGGGALETPRDDFEYWLCNCHDFLVDSESGKDVGVVNRVELAPGSHRAVALIVTSGWFGRHVRRIAAVDVREILPGERRLIVKDAAAGFARPPRMRA